MKNLKIGVIFLGGLILVGSMTGKPTPAAPSCKSDWTKCADNSDIVNNYSGMSAAQVDCKLQAEDHATYGTPEWPWLPFSHFYPGTNYSAGIATLIEPKAKFQNGFGAMAHSRVVCIYDLRTKKVLSINIS